MRHPAHHIFEFTPETLREWCGQRGMPAFRAAQILEWVYQRGVSEPALMSNLARRDRETLARAMTFLSGCAVRHQRATDGTQKLLIQWDGEGTMHGQPHATPAAAPEQAPASVLGPHAGPPAPAGSHALPLLAASSLADTSRQTECVMIPVHADDGTVLRATACISSQVGCPVGCRFCASGVGGLEGNLSAGRIVEQVWRLARLPEVERITNVVFMGMGEPLANLRAVVHAVRTLAAPWGLGIGGRRITISTVGLPQAIRRLAAELDVPVTLALSLHAPTDELRRRLIPWAEYTTIAELLAACQEWFEKTGREITLEYTLLREVNDRPEHAAELARLARTLRANVNLIRYNEVAGMPFARPGTDDVRRFQEVLRGRGVNAHIRRSRGRDIAAACGQLRHEAGAVGTAAAGTDAAR
ncbi:MAG TPA: 23S rRNA (adenine(2503)-C(2))-methyltransferase RlmN [Phycisphaerales bacterium]|nr:23S rRNA (adenine(2503)-C(2))-methyltransferase RlmN [Phycisphaerales bacterium]